MKSTQYATKDNNTHSFYSSNRESVKIILYLLPFPLKKSKISV